MIPAERNSNENLKKVNTVSIDIPPPKDSTAIILANKNRFILEKYARILSTSPDSLNIKLYGFIDDWMGVPYKWGGTDKKGIDCSAFIRRLLTEVYN